MASKIIKQGTERALDIQQFFFLEDTAAAPRPSIGKPEWPDITVQSKAEPAPAPAHKDEAPGMNLIDAEKLQKEAYQKGYREGETVGQQAGEKKIQAAMKRYADAIIETGRIKPRLYAQAEHEVVKLAIEVAKKIVHREIQVDRNVIQTLVRVALSHISEKSSVTVRLNPADYKHVTEQSSKAALPEGWDMSLQSDNSIQQGGCIIETDCGDIDARIEERFREVERTFFEDLK